MTPLAKEKYTKLTDEQSLLQRTAEGSREAYSILYSHYYHGLYRFVSFVIESHEDAEEIIQDVFLKVWVKRATLPGIRSFDDYLFRMAKNRIFDISKQSSTRLKMIRQITRHSEEGADSTYNDMLFQAYHAAAQEAISQLPPRKKQIFLMNARDELTAREIADILGVSRVAIKKQLHEAAHFIKEYLRKNAGWILFIIVWMAVA
jgi:RNA polymerase sigma-19 factor, ECF subfamily